MSTQELRGCLVFVGFIIYATASACATSDTSNPVVSNWEQFQKHAEQIVDGHKVYIVEWDTALTLEQLRVYYDKQVAHSNIGVTDQASTVNVASGHDDIRPSSADSSNCPGTFVYHFSGYGGSQQYFNTFHGFSQDTHHIGTVANDAECLSYGIGSINAIYDENNILVNGEYRLCCNNDCGPSISLVSFTLDGDLRTRGYDGSTTRAGHRGSCDYAGARVDPEDRIHPTRQLQEGQGSHRGQRGARLLDSRGRVHRAGRNDA